MKCGLRAVRSMQNPAMGLLRAPQAQARPIDQRRWCSRKPEPLDKGGASHQTLASISQDAHDEIAVLQRGWSHTKRDIHRLTDQIDTPVSRLHMHRDVR